MCVAIYKPKNGHLPKKVLEACFKQNDDGAGFAVRVKGDNDGPDQIEVHKGYFTFDAFWKAWRNYGDDYQALLHFRIMTHGKIAPENCHPFLVTEGDRQLAVVHNGVLYDFTRFASEARSDSRAYVETAIGPLFKKFPKLLKNAALMALVERGTGSNNKVAIMENDGTVQLLNKYQWGSTEFQPGTPAVWFSNMAWKHSMDNTGKKIAGPTCDIGYQAYLEGADLSDMSDWDEAPWRSPEGQKALEKANDEVNARSAELKNDPATAALVAAPPKQYLLPATVKLPERAKNDTPNILTALGNGGPYKLVLNVPKHQKQRTEERRGPSDRTFWEDGYVDAYEGLPYSPASSTMEYQAGFTDAISELEGTEESDGNTTFILGYNDRLSGDASPASFESIKKRKIYKAGQEWADYMRIATAEESRNERAASDVTGGVPGDGGVLHGDMDRTVIGESGAGVDRLGADVVPRSGSIVDIANKAALLRN